MLYIGGHYLCVFTYQDFLDSIKHTLASGGNAMQVFLGDRNSTTLTTKSKLTLTEIKKIKNILTKNDIKLFIHASLTLNFANPLIKRYQWSLDNLIFDMKLGSKLGAIGCVIHLGVQMKERYLLNKYNNLSVIREAFNNMKKSVEYVIDNSPARIKIIIETNAGQKNKIATKIEELADLYHSLNKKYLKNIGFCIDTAHIFSAGYPIHTVKGVDDYFKLFNEKIGMKKVSLIHLNDSDCEFASGKDRHTNLLKGYIFKGNRHVLKELIKVVYHYNIPIILETRTLSKYKKEIKLVRSFVE